MKLSVQITLILFLGYVLEQFLPWWAIAIAAFAGGALATTGSNFLAGFVGIGLLWAGKALLTDLTTDVELADRVARIFMLHNKVLLLIVTFAISGLIGGFAAMSGGAARKLSVRSQG